MRKILKFKLPVLIFLAVLLGAGAGLQTVSADDDIDETPKFFRYTHEDGTVVFTDDPLKIPEKYRKSASPVQLPPLVTIPAPKPSPKTQGPTTARRIKSWFENQSFATKFAVSGILPLLIISLWGFYFLGGKTENPSAKLLIKLFMGLLVAGSVYLLYFLFMKSYAEKMTRDLPIHIDTGATPAEMLKPIKREEENRLQRIEDIANSP